MTTTPETSAAVSVLAAARESRRVANAAEADILAQTLAWIELHVTDDPADAATWGDTPVHLGGEGCPWVREFTLTELAAALGMSVASGRRLVSDVLELAFRMPRLWAKVQSGRTPAWQARAVADRTQHLSPEAASFVDTQVAEFVNKMSKTAVDKLVDETVARFMPELAKEERDAAADQRCFNIDHSQVSFAGTARIEGELDLADAIDLDTAIGHIAGELKDLGNDLPLDSRRALAAGELARRQFAFTYDWDDRTPEEIVPVTVEEKSSRWSSAGEERAGVSRPGPATRGSSAGEERAGVSRPGPSTTRPRREVTLYAHLSAEAVNTMTTTSNGATDSSFTINGNAVVRVEGHGGQLIMGNPVHQWVSIRANPGSQAHPRALLDLPAPRCR